MTDATLNRRRLMSLGLAVISTPLLARLANAASESMSKTAVLFDPEAPVLGNPKGDVTLVEYFDYQCPYCKKAHPDVMAMVKDDGNIRFVMKDWPIFGPPSLYASRLTLAAGPRRPAALDALMATDGRLTPQMVEYTLKNAGFDVAALDKAYGKDRARIDALLDRNGSQAEGFGFMGTPAYIAGLTIFPGVPEMADLEAAIFDARATR